MAIKKYLDRKQSYSESKEDYVRVAAIMASCDAENIRIIKAKLSEDEAKAKLKSFLETSDITVQRGINAKLLNAIKSAGEPIMHKEYYSVIASYFHVSEVEYDYSYVLNGNTINITPKRKGANMDFSVFVETLDGRYYKTLVGNDKTPMDKWSALLEDECISDFEDGFVAHELLAEDSERESKLSMKYLSQKLTARLKEIVQDELGSARRLSALGLIDKEYSYNTYVFAAPFYVFQYDTGKQIVTVTVDAYSGEVSTPVVNNPLARALFAHEMEEPKLNIALLIICAMIMPFMGGVLYALWYRMQKGKYDKSTFEGVPKYTYEELKKLM